MAGQRKRPASDFAGEHLEAGEAAFRGAKYGEAATEYQQAAEAVNILGRDDAESRTVRQKAKELNAMAHLPVSPSTVMPELCRKRSYGESVWRHQVERTI